MIRENVCNSDFSFRKKKSLQKEGFKFNLTTKRFFNNTWIPDLYPASQRFYVTACTSTSASFYCSERIYAFCPKNSLLDPSSLCPMASSRKSQLLPYSVLIVCLIVVSQLVILSKHIHPHSNGVSNMSCSETHLKTPSDSSVIFAHSVSFPPLSIHAQLKRGLLKDQIHVKNAEIWRLQRELDLMKPKEVELDEVRANKCEGDNHTPSLNMEPK